MNRINRLLIFLSGASNEILEKCPDFERNKYASLGMTILFTAIFSIISATYALNTIFDNSVLSILFGSIWGMMIFNLDRFIIMTMTNTGNKFKDLISAIPRIILAMIIAIVISKPLEIKILEPEINKWILENEASTGLLSQVQALSELSKSSETFYWVSLMITLLIFVVELSPIIVRLISPPGMYDYLINSTLELEIDFFEKLKRELSQGKHQDVINDLFEVSKRNNNVDLENRLIIITRKLKAINEDLILNTIDNNFASKETNRIYESLLKIIDDLREYKNYKIPLNQSVNVRISDLPTEVLLKGLKSSKSNN